MNIEEYNEKEFRNYHKRQHESIYRSTECFLEWLRGGGEIENPETILDVGAGLGANLNYMARLFPKSKLMGVEIDNSLIEEYNKHYKLPNTNIVKGDAYLLSELFKGSKIDLITSFQFLLAMEKFDKIIEQMCLLNPKWIAASTLCTEFNMTYVVKYENYNVVDENGDFFKGFQHIFSLDMLKKLFCSFGYNNFMYKRFLIDIDLPQTSTKEKGTYTISTDKGERIQMSADFHMPWYFILAYKD